MRDLRYAIRVLLKAPTFTIAAVFTLALCIGANTAIYTVVDRVLLRPLPYPQPERLAEVVTRFSRGGIGYGQTGGTWEALQRGSYLRRTGDDRWRIWIDRREHGRRHACRVREAAARVGGVLPRARRAARHRPRVHRRRGSGRRSRCRDSQPSVVDAVVQRRSRRTRPFDHAARRAAHDRWRDARWLHDRRTDGPVDPGTAVPDLRRRRAELRDHRPAEAGCDVDPGRRGDRRRRATSDRRSLSQSGQPGARTADSAAARPDRSGPPADSDSVGRGRRRAPDRMREHRRSPHGARRRARPRNGDAHRARRRTLGDRSPVADRERCARRTRRRGGRAARVRRVTRIRDAAGKRLRRCTDPHRPGRARACDHVAQRARHQRRVRFGARAAGDRRQSPRDARGLGQRLDRRRGAQLAAPRPGRR